MNLERKLMTSIIPATVEQFKEEVARCSTKLIEHRIDGFLNPTRVEIDYNDYNFDFLATNRPQNGSKITVESEKERIEILKRAITNGVKFVDIEIETAENLRIELFQLAKQYNVITIISYHNYDKTPTIEELTEIVKKMKHTRTDIIKCACMAKSYADAHVMINLQHIWGSNMLAFGMGRYGSFSRVISLLYGAPFMYVPLDNKTAPGQLYIEEIKEIMKFLNQN